jgi:hypothetical protein
MDPSEENAATLPGVLRELLARESTKMINKDSKQKEMRGSANFGDNNHGTNLDLLTHEPQIDFKTRKEIILQTKSNDARGFHQINHRVSDSYSECTETKMQAQPLEPPTGDPKPEKMDPQRFNATLDMEKEATTSTPQSTTTKFNQPEEFVAAGKTFSQGTDQPTTEQDNEGREAYQTPEKQGNSSELQGNMENATSGKKTEENKTSRSDQPIQPGAEDLESFSTPGVFKAPNEDKLILDMSAFSEEVKKQLLSLLATSTPATVSKRDRDRRYAKIRGTAYQMCVLRGAYCVLTPRISFPHIRSLSESPKFIKHRINFSKQKTDCIISICCVFVASLYC